MRCPICEHTEGIKLFSAPDRFHGRDTYYQLMRCSSCTLVWVEDPPKPEEMSCHYGRQYHAAITSSGETHLDKRWSGPRNKILEFAQRGSLLDIGCSSGGFLRTLAGPNWELYGIEMSPDEAQRAEENSGAKIFVGEILNAPFSPSSFDVITGFHVLEHVYQPTLVVEKLLEWLKPGGILYIQVPNIDSLEATIFRSYWYGLELPRHVYHFSPASLNYLFSSLDLDQLTLCTLSHNHIEASMHYVLESIRARAGLAVTPLATVRAVPSIGWRIVRKALRLCFLSPFGLLASTVGRGAGIEVMYRKRALNQPGLRLPQLAPMRA